MKKYDKYYWTEEWLDTAEGHKGDAEAGIKCNRIPLIEEKSYLIVESSIKAFLSLLDVAQNRIIEISHYTGEAAEELRRKLPFPMKEDIEKSLGYFDNNHYVFSRYPTKQGSPNKRASEEKATRLYDNSILIYKWAKKAIRLLETHKRATL